MKITKSVTNNRLKSGLRWVYIVLGILIMICFGTVYSWSIFRTPVENIFSIGSTLSGLPYMASLAFYALFMMLSGRFINRLSPRFMVLIGALLLSLGWILASFSGNIYMLTITYGIIGGAGVGIAYGVPIAIVTRWFPERKGLVIGVVLMGFGLSPLLTAPLARHLIEIFGVMKSFLILGLSYGIIIPILSYPFKYPSIAENEIYNSNKAKAAESNHMNTKDMIKSKSFKGLYLNFIIGTMIGLMLVGLTNSVGTRFIGLSHKRVASFISIFAIFNGLGRPVFGWITDKLSSKKAMLISYSLIIIAASFMSFANSGSVYLFTIAFSIFWFNLGGWLAIAPASTGILFGEKHHSQNYGVVFTAYGIGAISGVAASGLILDIFNNFHYIFYMIIGVCILASFMTLKSKE